MEMQTILVTGCAGFIGSNLSEALLEDGYRVIGIDNFDPFYDKSIKEKNLEKLHSFENFKFYQLDLSLENALFIIENTIHAIIHLAAKAGVLPSLKDPKAYIKANIDGSNNVLDFMQQRNIKKLLFASSSSVYGNSVQIPFKESEPLDKPISPYAFTKKSCELQNFVYHHLYGIDILNLRFFTVFGPRQRPDLAIHKFVKLIEQKQPINMYGDGSSARDYTYVEDTISGISSALTYLINNEKVYDTINLGNNTPISLREMISSIYEIMGETPNIKQMPMQPGDVNITYADISKAQKLLNYHPKTSFKEGLVKFIKWHNEQA